MGGHLRDEPCNRTVEMITPYCHIVYDAGALNCIIKRRLYRGKICYLPYNPDSTEQSTIEKSDISDFHGQSCKANLEDTIIQEKVNVKIDVEENNELQKAAEEASTTNTQQTGTQLENTGTSTQVESTTFKSQVTVSEQEHTDSDSSTQDDSQGQEKGSQELVKQYGPRADLLPPLSEPVPDNWETLERDFMSISLLMIPHMARNVFGDPEVSIGAGKIRLVICGEQITRLGMFGLLTKADTGQHVEMDGVLRKDVTAFRLEPYTTPGMLTIDGETVHYGPIQVQVHHALARIMCRKRQV